MFDHILHFSSRVRWCRRAAQASILQEFRAITQEVRTMYSVRRDPRRTGVREEPSLALLITFSPQVFVVDYRQGLGLDGVVTCNCTPLCQMTKP